MVSLLALFFIRTESSEEQKRTLYGILCGCVGIFLNLFLVGIKLFAGFKSGTVSIIADGFNNLSDAGASIVTLMGFRLASKKPDREHPYGHGRMEYIAGFIVSMIILLMGLELMKESVSKILHPEAPDFSFASVWILLIAIFVKLYMFFYNSRYGKKLNSTPLKATASDSLSDVCATTIVLLCLLVSHYQNIQLDGYAGCVVSGFILFTGYNAAKDALDPLLGNPPSDAYIDHIEEIVLNFDENIVGVHDLIIHDYGPGRQIISLHAEVPQEGDILQLHDIVDNLEKKLEQDLGCVATIHMDPIAINDPVANILYEETKEIVEGIYEKCSIHDFRIVAGETHTNLIFDIAVPYECPLPDKELKRLVKAEIADVSNGRCYAVITLDRTYHNHDYLKET